MQKRRGKPAGLLLRMCVLLGLVSVLGLGQGCETLGVYSLTTYENDWKGDLSGWGPVNDPYYDFWTAMRDGSVRDGYAHKPGSRRYRNSEVTIETILPIPGDDLKSWDEFSLVFFWGHNNTIVPPHSGVTSYYNYEGNSWIPKSGNLADLGWGDTTNYDYYAVRPINIAKTHPGSVTYLYHEYTSALLGYPYDYCGSAVAAGSYEHFPNLYTQGKLPYRKRWNQPIQGLEYGQLGDWKMKWLILHGCQAVITANYPEGTYNPIALNIFNPVQGKFHIVLGHYKWEGQPQPLVGLAYKLVNGWAIQDAYFSVHPGLRASAIAAEENPFPGWANSTMVNDRWTDDVDDIPDATCFTMRWLTPTGMSQEEWED